MEQEATATIGIGLNQGASRAERHKSVLKPQTMPLPLYTAVNLLRLTGCEKIGSDLSEAIVTYGLHREAASPQTGIEAAVAESGLTQTEFDHTIVSIQAEIKQAGLPAMMQSTTLTQGQQGEIVRQLQAISDALPPQFHKLNAGLKELAERTAEKADGNARFMQSGAVQELTKMAAGIQEASPKARQAARRALANINSYVLASSETQANADKIAALAATAAQVTAARFKRARTKPSQVRAVMATITAAIQHNHRDTLQQILAMPFANTGKGRRAFNKTLSTVFFNPPTATRSRHPVSAGRGGASVAPTVPPGSSHRRPDTRRPAPEAAEAGETPRPPAHWVFLSRDSQGNLLQPPGPGYMEITLPVTSTSTTGTIQIPEDMLRTDLRTTAEANRHIQEVLLQTRGTSTTALKVWISREALKPISSVQYLSDKCALLGGLNLTGLADQRQLRREHTDPSLKADIFRQEAAERSRKIPPIAQPIADALTYAMDTNPQDFIAGLWHVVQPAVVFAFAQSLAMTWPEIYGFCPTVATSAGITYSRHAIRGFLKLINLDPDGKTKAFLTNILGKSFSWLKEVPCFAGICEPTTVAGTRLLLVEQYTTKVNADGKTELIPVVSSQLAIACSFYRTANTVDFPRVQMSLKNKTDEFKQTWEAIKDPYTHQNLRTTLVAAAAAVLNILPHFGLKALDYVLGNSLEGIRKLAQLEPPIWGTDVDGLKTMLPVKPTGTFKPVVGRVPILYPSLIEALANLATEPLGFKEWAFLTVAPVALANFVELIFPRASYSSIQTLQLILRTLPVYQTSLTKTALELAGGISRVIGNGFDFRYWTYEMAKQLNPAEYGSQLARTAARIATEGGPALIHDSDIFRAIYGELQKLGINVPRNVDIAKAWVDKIIQVPHATNTSRLIEKTVETATDLVLRADTIEEIQNACPRCVGHIYETSGGGGYYSPLSKVLSKPELQALLEVTPVP